MQVKLLLVRVRMQVCLKIFLYRQVIEGGEDNDVYECVAGYIKKFWTICKLHSLPSL